MKTVNEFKTVIGVVGVLALGGCGTMNDPFNSSPGTPSAGTVNSRSAYAGYGVVQSIDLVQQGNTGIGGSDIGLGTIAGAVVGGVLGHQVGSGRGNTAATIAGAAGGAYVGHELENRQKQRTAANVYQFTIRMDSGSYQTLTQNTSSGLSVGDRVRIDNGIVQRN